MASGWNLWVWLPCIGVVSGCCCKEVYSYPHNNWRAEASNWRASEASEPLSYHVNSGP